MNCNRSVVAIYNTALFIYGLDRNTYYGTADRQHCIEFVERDSCIPGDGGMRSCTGNLLQSTVIGG